MAKTRAERQAALPLFGREQWERMPGERQDLCRDLVGQLLLETVRIEAGRGERRDEPED